MSGERLSRLQKWILEELYIEQKKTAAIDPDRAFWRNHIFHRAWEDGLFKEHDGSPNKPTLNPWLSSRVIFSRSIWTLIERDYLRAEGPASFNMIAIAYGMAGKPIEKFKEDFKDFFSKPETKIPGMAMRGIVQAKLIWLTEKGRAKAQELLNVNKEKLTIRLGTGNAAMALGGELGDPGPVEVES